MLTSTTVKQSCSHFCSVLLDTCLSLSQFVSDACFPGSQVSVLKSEGEQICLNTYTVARLNLPLDLRLLGSQR